MLIELSETKKAARLLMGHYFSDDGVQQHHQLPGIEVDIWKEMLDSSKNLPNSESPGQFGGQDACKIPCRIIFIYYFRNF